MARGAQGRDNWRRGTGITTTKHVVWGEVGRGITRKGRRCYLPFVWIEVRILHSLEDLCAYAFVCVCVCECVYCV